jgi:hypothetical protein
MRNVLIALVLVCVEFSFVGCATSKDIDINALNKDGSPVWTTTEPQAKNTIYGVGKAKLTIKSNSEMAAEALSRADLAAKIQSTAKEYISYYSNDSVGLTATAYEQLIMNIVNLAITDVRTEQTWEAKDGTVWVLVSISRKSIEGGIRSSNLHD